MSSKFYNVGATFDYSISGASSYFDPRQPSTEIVNSNKTITDLVWHETFNSGTTPAGVNGFNTSGFYRKRYTPGQSGIHYFHLVDKISEGSYESYADNQASISTPWFPSAHFNKSTKEIEFLYGSTSVWMGGLRAAPGTGTAVTNAIIEYYTIAGSYLNGWLVQDADLNTVGFLGLALSAGNEMDHRLDYPYSERTTYTAGIGGEFIFEADYGTVSVPSDISDIFPSGSHTSSSDSRYSDFKNKSIITNSYGGGYLNLNFQRSETQTLALSSGFAAKESDGLPISQDGSLGIDMVRDESDDYVSDIFGRNYNIDLETVNNWKLSLHKVSGYKYTKMIGGFGSGVIKATYAVATPVNYVEPTLYYLANSVGWIESGNTGWKIGAI